MLHFYFIFLMVSPKILVNKNREFYRIIMVDRRQKTLAAIKIPAPRTICLYSTAVKFIWVFFKKREMII